MGILKGFPSVLPPPPTLHNVQIYSQNHIFSLHFAMRHSCFNLVSHKLKQRRRIQETEKKI